MAFRKWLLVLAVMALVAVPTFAQSCTLTPGNPSTIRSGGLTELVGDVVLTCAGHATNTITVNVQVFLQGATVSNRVRTGAAAADPPQCPYVGFSACVTDSLLLINDNTVFSAEDAVQDPILGLLQPAVSGADSPTNRNSVLFPSVVLPAGTTTQLRITNIRVVAPDLSTINLGLPTQVIESVSFLPQVQISPSFQVVANVLPAFQFRATPCDDASKSSSLTYRQCISQNAGMYPDGGSTGRLSFNVKFTEGFGNAFKERGTTTQTVPGASAQVNLFESGLTLNPPQFGAAFTSYADAGTILRVSLENVPEGVKVFATSTPTVVGTSANIAAVGVIGTDVAGTTTCGAPGTGVPVYHMIAPDASNAFGWEITQSAITSAREISFGIAVAYKSDTSALLPALTGDKPMHVLGQLWPSSAVAQASTGAAVPRFRNVLISSGDVKIVACATTLLYPFVVTSAEWETGIAISNTSLDHYGTTTAPLTTATQTGNCKVYFFDGSTGAPAPYSFPNEFKPGMVQANVLSAMTAGAPFTGYAIASCSFQFAHGYAYIVDQVKGSAQGYLALIIPDNGVSTSRNPDPFTANGAGSGEQLAY